MSDHHHHNNNSHGDVHTKANQAFFDSIAHKYEEYPHAEEVAKKVARSFLESHPFNKESTTVLDFACGIGLISRELHPFSKEIVGVDISQKMVDRYNASVTDLGISSEEIHAEVLDLKGLPTELGGQRFDVIVCASAYHHFPSITKTTEILAYFLKPSGRLLVADLLKHGENEPQIEPHPDFHSHTPRDWRHVVPHHAGITEGEIRGAFIHAKLEDFEIKTTTIHVPLMNRMAFVVSGTKGAEGAN